MMRSIIAAGALLALAGCAEPHARLAKCGEGPRQAAFIPTVSDDGQSTFFEFPAETRIPAFFIVNPDGNEAATNYTVDGSRVHRAPDRAGVPVARRQQRGLHHEQRLEPDRRQPWHRHDQP